MLRSIKSMEGLAIGATDGDIGVVKDCYFDDLAWVVRYLVVETGTWLSSRKVLISPFSVNDPGSTDSKFQVSITQAQVRNSPDIDTDKPVSRQHETSYLGYYGYPLYWNGIGLWGDESYPGLMLPGNQTGSDTAEFRRIRAEHERVDEAAEARRRRHEDPHLRSANAVIGYDIQANDGAIGHVEGLLVEVNTWAIRYMVVNTSNWWVGHQVIIAPEWIQEVSWADSMVKLDLNKQSIKDAPAYDPTRELQREQEIGVYRHYGRDGYWSAREEGAHRPVAGTS